VYPVVLRKFVFTQKIFHYVSNPASLIAVGGASDARFIQNKSGTTRREFPLKTTNLELEQSGTDLKRGAEALQECVMDSCINDAKYFSAINKLFNEEIPFGKVLGLKVESISYERARISCQMRDELLGYYKREMLHGTLNSWVPNRHVFSRWMATVFMS